MARVGQAIREKIAAGSLLATGALGKRATAGARVVKKDGAITVEDPPSGDGWMAAGGYSLAEYASKEEAIASAKETLGYMGDAVVEMIAVTEMHPAPNAPRPATPSQPLGVVPYLAIDGAAEASAFCQRAFGAKEVARMPAQDGKRLMHCHLDINGGALMIADAFPEMGGRRCSGRRATRAARGGRRRRVVEARDRSEVYGEAPVRGRVLGRQVRPAGGSVRGHLGAELTREVSGGGASRRWRRPVSAASRLFANARVVAPSKMIARFLLVGFASLSLACGARSGLPLPEGEEDTAVGSPSLETGVDGGAAFDVSDGLAVADTFVDRGPHTAVPDPRLPRCEDRPITCLDGDIAAGVKTLRAQLAECAPGMCGQATYRFDRGGCLLSVETINLTQSEANCLVQPALAPKKRFLCLKGAETLIERPCTE